MEIWHRARFFEARAFVTICIIFFKLFLFFKRFDLAKNFYWGMTDRRPQKSRPGPGFFGLQGSVSPLVNMIVLVNMVSGSRPNWTEKGVGYLENVGLDSGKFDPKSRNFDSTKQQQVKEKPGHGFWFSGTLKLHKIKFKSSWKVL